MFTNTGVMCMITVNDNNREDGQRQVDLGNFFEDENGQKCLITSTNLAKRYSHLVDVPIYVRKNTGREAGTDCPSQTNARLDRQEEAR